jgi:hypothetical protein
VNSAEQSDQPTKKSEQQSGSQPPVEPTVEKTEMPDNPVDQAKREKSTASELAREFRTFEKLSLLVNVVLALIGIVALRVYNGQLGEMRRANDVSRDALRAQTRPWIGLETVQSDPLTIDGRGWVATIVRTRPKNFGNYPGAIYGCTFAELVVTDIEHGSKDIADRLDRLMTSKLPSGHGPVTTIYPSTGRSCLNSTFVTPAQIIGNSKENVLTAYLIGCILYTDQFGGTHHTVFSYWYQIPKEIPQGVTFRLDSGSVPAGVWIEHRTLVD